MKYAVETGSVAMIYTPSFKKIGSGIQNFMGGGFTGWKRHKPTLGKQVNKT
jgi:hypothetical protein